MTEEVMKRTAE